MTEALPSARPLAFLLSSTRPNLSPRSGSKIQRALFVYHHGWKSLCVQPTAAFTGWLKVWGGTN